jgi:hypothetical protein
MQAKIQNNFLCRPIVLQQMNGERKPIDCAGDTANSYLSRERESYRARQLNPFSGVACYYIGLSGKD